MLFLHRSIRTWSRKVDLFIALSEHCRKRFSGILPPSKIVVKSNSAPTDLGLSSGDGEFALYVGRLAPEKGIRTLIEAWQQLSLPVPLKILGDGPLKREILSACEKRSDMDWLGWRPWNETAAFIGSAAALIVPSIWEEPFGSVTVEAFSRGTPVIASRIGSLPEIIKDGETGVLFDPGSSSDLADKVCAAFQHPSILLNMRSKARAAYEQKYTAQENYQQLINIYKRALTMSHEHLSTRPEEMSVL